MRRARRPRSGGLADRRRSQGRLTVAIGDGAYDLPDAGGRGRERCVSRQAGCAREGRPTGSDWCGLDAVVICSFMSRKMAGE
jgi:hypothetical protein